MKPTETTFGVEPDRAAALAAEALANRPLSGAAAASLAEAVERLPDSMVESDDEARAATK